MSRSAEEIIAEAVASGEWKEKQDVTTNKKYYVNAKTKKSLWSHQLAKEWEKAGGQPASPVSPAAGHHRRKGGESGSDAEGGVGPKISIQEDREAKLRKRAENEAQMKASIASLEQQKIDLDMEINRLAGPVEAESQQLAELRASVGDLKFGRQVVETSVAEKRRQRDRDLQAATTKLTALKAAVDSDKQYRDAVDLRHRQLVAEAMELKADLHKEQITTEALRSSVRAAERKVDEANIEMSKQKSEIAMLEELVAQAEKELAEVSKKKNVVALQMEEYTKEKETVKARLEIMARSAAATAVGGGSSSWANSAEGDLLMQLMRKYDAKRKTLAALSNTQGKQDTVAMLEHGNFKLRGLVAAAKRDNEVLSRLAKVLEHETQRALRATAALRSEGKAPTSGGAARAALVAAAESRHAHGVSATTAAQYPAPTSPFQRTVFQ